MCRRSGELAKEVRQLSARLATPAEPPAPSSPMRGSAAARAASADGWQALGDPRRGSAAMVGMDSWQTASSTAPRTSLSMPVPPSPSASDLVREDIDLQRHRWAVHGKFKAWESERDTLLRQVAELKRSLEQREFELASRPTHRLTQLLRNKVADLERQAETQRHPNRKDADTRTLIREDRRRHALERRQRSQGVEHFRSVREMPREELELVLADLCRLLGVTRPTDAEAALRVLSTSAAKAGPQQIYPPRAESSASKASCSNCGTVHLEEANFCRHCGQQAQRHTPEAASSEFLARLSKALGCTAASNVLSEEVLLARARELADVSLRVGVVLTKADQEMRTCKESGAPNVCVMLRHFMKLFDVQTIQGCLPAMNTLFSRLGELTTLHKIVREQLGLRPGSGPAAVAETIRAVGGRTGSSEQLPASNQPTARVTRGHPQFQDRAWR
eukprot:TRINITY_DN22674_c0_g1_i1.p1 TRINITY_DN22674_c0_g1~~TRINITY_DN22674_c0_g1_i1.p1  ORF type:complete len:447 (-),score=102.42 TRINITY_DN22674_c0_g1_i1:8-1348(-)